MPLPDSVYKWLKWTAAIVLPALATLAGTIGIAVGFEKTDVLVTIIVAVGTFIGSLVGVSTGRYNQAKKNDNSKEIPGNQP